MLLALDLASTVGVAWGSEAVPKPLYYGARRFGGKGEPVGAVFDRFDEWLWDTIETIRPSHVFCESPFIGPKVNASTVQILYGMRAFVMRACVREKLVFRQVTPMEANQFFVGSRRGRLEKIPGEDRRQAAARRRVDKKAATIAAAKMRGLPTDSDDAADALAVWFFGQNEIRGYRGQVPANQSDSLARMT